MKLLLDTSRVTFSVTKVTEPKTDNEGRHKADRRTGELMFVVQVMALEDGAGADIISITLLGQPPKVTVGQIVSPVELEALPWATNGRSGVAFRAKALNAQSAVKAA